MKKNGSKSLVVKAIPVPLDSHPDAPYPLPKHEFTLGLIAPKGAGKTTTICNLLKFYQGYFHTILIFSPTIDSDEKWDWVKKLPLLVDNLPLKRWLASLEQTKQEGLVHRGGPSMETLAHLNAVEKDFSPLVGADCFFDSYEEGKLKEVMEEQMEMIRLLKKHGKSKYLANRILVIFDDLVGSGLFGGQRGNYFKGLNTRHRHYSASFIMVSQGYKEIPKTIRTNWSCLIVFEIGNEKEVEVIYEEYAMGLKRDDWMQVYKHATQEDHCFLYLNYQAPRGRRIMKNFTDFLMVRDV